MDVGRLEKPIKGMARSAATSLVAGLRQTRNFAHFVHKESRAFGETSFLSALGMWRRGFKAQAPTLYSLDLRRADAYLPDLPYLLRGEEVNGPYKTLLNDKLASYHLFRGFEGVMPRHFAMIRRGSVCPLPDGQSWWNRAPLSRVACEAGPLVLKPMRGTGSTGLWFVLREGDHFLLNDTRVSTAEIDAFGGGLDDYLVCEKVSPHEQLRKIAPRCTNCLRLLTLWDVDRDEPFIAAAGITFGTSATYPTDIRGINAFVEAESGRICGGIRFGGDRFEQHPESGVRFEGLLVPHFDRIVAQMLNICRQLPFLRQVGWDIAITDDGFKIIEGNNHPSPTRHQIHFPLLRDPRVRRFYQHHGVLS